MDADVQGLRAPAREIKGGRHRTSSVHPTVLTL
jgi:hypothetical protein